jgi:hypothetical protein
MPGLDGSALLLEVGVDRMNASLEMVALDRKLWRTLPLHVRERKLYGHLAMKVTKGMVVVGGVTYRVTKLYTGKYEVVRIFDDRRVGTFECEPKLSVEPEGVSPELLSEIAIVALKQGKVSWSQRPPPV